MHSKTIYFNAPNWSVLDQDSPPEFINRPFYQLRCRLEAIGYNCVAINNSQLNDLYLGSQDKVLFFDISFGTVNILKRKRFPAKNLVLINLESPIIMPMSQDTSYHSLFDKIYTWNLNLVDNKKYFKLSYCAFDWLEVPDRYLNFHDKKLAVMLVGNKKKDLPNELYSLRRQFIDYFETTGTTDFDFYGPGWGDCNYQNYKLCALNRIECLSKYQFCICFENCIGFGGYLTEKILNCFVARVVPVYLGDPLVARYIPKDCFIDGRVFKDDPVKLHVFLKNFDQSKHEEFLHNIDKFVESSGFDQFRSKFLVDTMMQAAIGG